MSTTTNSPRTEAAFTPTENTLTALFETTQAAETAITALDTFGVPNGAATIVRSQFVKPAHQSVNIPEKVAEEVLKSLSETFSDDDKLFGRIDRVIAAGGAAISLEMTGLKDRREELVKLLKAQGASAIYYWGAWLTEQL